MAFWNKNDTKETNEEKFARFSEGERKYGNIPKKEFKEGTTVVEGRPPEDRWKAFAADDKEFKSNQDKISRSRGKEERKKQKEEANLQFLRDAENRRVIESYDDRAGNKALKKARKVALKEIKQDLKDDKTSEWQMLKKDIKDVGTDIKTASKYVGEKGSKFIKSSGLGTARSGRIDPLKGLVKKSKAGKGKRGRPRKYAPVPKTNRPRGRPIDNDMSIAGFKFFDDRGLSDVQPEPYIPPTREQARLLQLFGNKQQFWGYGGNPVRINKQITSGHGLIKNGDGGATGRMFGIFRR